MSSTGVDPEEVVSGSTSETNVVSPTGGVEDRPLPEAQAERGQQRHDFSLGTPRFDLLLQLEPHGEEGRRLVQCAGVLFSSRFDRREHFIELAGVVFAGSLVEPARRQAVSCESIGTAPVDLDGDSHQQLRAAFQASTTVTKRNARFRRP